MPQTDLISREADIIVEILEKPILLPPLWCVQTPSWWTWPLPAWSIKAQSEAATWPETWTLRPSPQVQFYPLVPGGVGLMITTALLKNTFQAAVP